MIPVRSTLPSRVSAWLTLAGSVTAAVTLLPAAARASGPATAVIRLERSRAASDCPDARTLGRIVNALARRSAIVDEGASVILRVGIDRSKAGYTASLIAKGDRAGERDLEDAGATCEALTQALAVSIALLLDEDGPEQPPPEPKPAPKVKPVAPPRPEGPGHGAPLPSAMLDILAIESAGLVGRSTFGVEGNADFRITPHFSVGGGFIGMVDGEQHFGAGTLRVNLVAVRSNACFTFRVADRSIGGALCGFPAVGAMIASAGGYDQNHTASQPWVALGAGAIADGPIVGPLSFAARLDLFVPLVRPSFIIENLGGAPPGQTGTAFEASHVGVAVGVGVRALIP